MSKVFFIVLIFLALTACSSSPVNKNVSHKHVLIESANSGDVKAMVELNTTYLFPQTKEGYDYYVKWYDSVLKSKDANAIMLFSDVYKEYMRMFINGKSKYFKLLETAMQLGNEDAMFRLLAVPSRIYKKGSSLERKIIKQSDEPSLLKLLAFYDYLMHYEDSKKIKEILINRGYKTTYDKKEFNFREILNFKDYKNKAPDSNESKRVLGYVYYENEEYKKGNEILDQFAEKGNEDAMFTLISRLQFDDIDKGTTYGIKWANSILTSQNPSLILRLSNTLKEYNTPDAERIKKQVNEYFIKTENMYYLRDLAKIHHTKNPAIERQYLLEAAELGDVASSHELARGLFYSRSASNIKQALSIYEKLADRNDTVAIVTLGDFYKSPLSPFEGMQDADKAIMYYEMAMELGETTVIKKLLCLYFCSEPISPKKLISYENKVDLYVNQLAQMQVDADVIEDLAFSYYQGFKVEKNIEKAAYYFVKSAEAGNIDGYKSAAIIYKNDLNNEEKYLAYLRKGVEEYDGLSAYELGKHYEEKKDIANALKYYQLAVDYNQSDAVFRLVRLKAELEK